MFNRRLIHVGTLKFFSDSIIKVLGARKALPEVKIVNLDDELFFKRSALRHYEQLVCPQTPSAITAGIAALGTTQILAATPLTTALQTITSFVAQPDVPRTINVVSTAGCGDGTYVGANARIVKITGTDIWGNTITEWVPLNTTTQVQTKKAFASVTSVILPVEGDGTDTVALGYGTGFPFVFPVDAAAKVLEFGVKATAATAYTVTALPTLAVGSATSTLAADVEATATTLTLASGTGFPDGAQRTMAEIVTGDGSFEEVIITDRTTVTLTVVRGANGTTAARWESGTTVIYRAPMTFTHAPTANDRLRIGYQTYNS